MCYAYELREITKELGPDPLLAQERLDVTLENVDEMKAGMRGWALEKLAAGNHRIGLYAVEFGQLGLEGRCEEEIDAGYVVWDGGGELAFVR